MEHARELIRTNAAYGLNGVNSSANLVRLRGVMTISKSGPPLWSNDHLRISLDMVRFIVKKADSLKAPLISRISTGYFPILSFHSIAEVFSSKKLL